MLSDLTFFSEHFASVVRQKDGIKAILEAMAHHSDSFLHTNACTALHNMVTSDSISKKKMLEEGVIPIIEAKKSIYHQDEGVVQAADSLLHLLKQETINWTE